MVNKESRSLLWNSSEDGGLASRVLSKTGLKNLAEDYFVYLHLLKRRIVLVVVLLKLNLIFLKKLGSKLEESLRSLAMS